MNVFVLMLKDMPLAVYKSEASAKEDKRIMIKLYGVKESEVRIVERPYSVFSILSDMFNLGKEEK